MRIPDTGQLFVFAIPECSPEDLAWIQDVRARFDPAFAIVDPHFTLVFPAHPLSADELANHVREHTGYQDRFQVNLAGIEVWDPGRGDDINISLVPAAGFAEILELHDRLYTGILESSLRKDLPYKPHITVGRFEDAAAANRVVEELRDAEIDFTAQMAELTVANLNAGELSIVDTIQLG